MNFFIFKEFEEQESENKVCRKQNLIMENLCVWKILDNLKVHTFDFRIAADVADFTVVAHTAQAHVSSRLMFCSVRGCVCFS